MSGGRWRARGPGTRRHRPTDRRWHWMRYDDASPEKLEEMRDELLDHIAARALEDTALDESSRKALRTAAECSLRTERRLLPQRRPGDLPLIGERLSSEDIAFGDIVEQAPTARTWVDTFEICVVSGLVWEWRRVIGLLLRDDCAPAIRDRTPCRHRLHGRVIVDSCGSACPRGTAHSSAASAGPTPCRSRLAATTGPGARIGSSGLPPWRRPTGRGR